MAIKCLRFKSVLMPIPLKVKFRKKANRREGQDTGGEDEDYERWEEKTPESRIRSGVIKIQKDDEIDIQIEIYKRC